MNCIFTTVTFNNRTHDVQRFFASIECPRETKCDRQTRGQKKRARVRIYKCGFLHCIFDAMHNCTHKMSTYLDERVSQRRRWRQCLNSFFPYIKLFKIFMQIVRHYFLSLSLNLDYKTVYWFRSLDRSRFSPLSLSLSISPSLPLSFPFRFRLSFIFSFLLFLLFSPPE